MSRSHCGFMVCLDTCLFMKTCLFITVNILIPKQEKTENQGGIRSPLCKISASSWDGLFNFDQFVYQVGWVIVLQIYAN